jgi:hypothetical protein
VTVPKENIWQGLRTDCLNTIPEGSRTKKDQPATLAIWQRRGYYSVTSSTNKSIELIASSEDFGSALLSDAECLLDHASEHQVHLWKQINSQEWSSPTWQAVTVYYWSYYLTLAITRLTGRTAWFIDKDHAKALKTLAPGTPAPSAGCFRLECGPYVSATERKILLMKRGSRVHDEIWRLWFGGCKDRLRLPSSGTLEDRLFTALVRSANKLGEDWPSAFRNLVNYRTGFAYTAGRNIVILKSLSYLRQPTSYDTADLINRFEDGVVRVKSTIDTPQEVLELLVDLTLIIHALVTELHSELLDRRRLDKRWRDARRRFVQKHGLINDGNAWPL